MFGLTAEEGRAVENGPKRMAMAWSILCHMGAVGSEMTCEECLESGGFPDKRNERFYELAKAGCLIPTGRRKSTKSGGSAQTYTVNPKADFKKYLALRKGLQKAGLSQMESAVLAEGLRFITRWKKAKSHKGREAAAAALIDSLGGIASR